MTLDQAILAKVNTLPADKQQEVLDFVEFLTTNDVVKALMLPELAHPE